MKNTEEKLQIVSINPAEYGLEENKAKQISDMFKPMLDKMVELEKEFNIVSASGMSEDVCKVAKALRQKYVKVRTGTAAIHKELKAFYLQGGRFVDGWKTAQLMASQGIEEKLSSIEKHYENIELKRIADLEAKRKAELDRFNPDFIPDGLGILFDDVWDGYIKGVELAYNAKIQAEKDAEEARIENERKEAAERERIRLENEQLKKEAEEAAFARKIEQDKREKEEKERIAKQKEEREAREKKERAERAEYEIKLREERQEKERAEAELQAKKDAELKAENERKAAVESELNKGDVAKVQDLIDDLISIKTKYSFKSKKNKDMYRQVIILVDRIIGGVR